MILKYDWPDMPLDTPMTVGNMLVLNGREFEVSEAEFKLATGSTPQAAAKSTTNLTIVRKKVS